MGVTVVWSKPNPIVGLLPVVLKGKVLFLNLLLMLKYSGLIMLPVNFLSKDWHNVD